MALVGIEHREQARTSADRLAAGCGYLDGSGDHNEPGTLVDLVLLQPLPGGQVEGDHPPLAVGAQDLRLTRLDVERCDIPALHGAQPILTAAMVIAIDGPAGAGKSTVARGVAAAIGATYLDSGAMYRAVALATLRRGIDPDDGNAVAELAAGLEIGFAGERVLLGGEDVSADIRTPQTTAAASRVSVHPGVRAALVERQRELIASGPYVAEGRDIGTVVSPESPLKVFLSASDDERARRRADESGEPYEQVLAAQIERDQRDRDREHGAMVAAADAVELDTTGFDIDEVVARVVELARQRGLA